MMRWMNELQRMQRDELSLFTLQVMNSDTADLNESVVSCVRAA